MIRRYIAFWRMRLRTLEIDEIEPHDFMTIFVGIFDGTFFTLGTMFYLCSLDFLPAWPIILLVITSLLTPYPELILSISKKILHTNLTSSAHLLEKYGFQCPSIAALLSPNFEHKPMIFFSMACSACFFGIFAHFISIDILQIVAPEILITSTIWFFVLGKFLPYTPHKITEKIEAYCAEKRLSQQLKSVLMLRDLSYKGKPYPDLSIDLYAEIYTYLHPVDQVSATQLLYKIDHEHHTRYSFFANLSCLKPSSESVRHVELSETSPLLQEEDFDIETSRLLLRS